MLTAVEVSKGNLQEDKPAHNFTTKVSYSIILTSLESVHDGNFDSIDRIFVCLTFLVIKHYYTMQNTFPYWECNCVFTEMNNH